MLALLVVLAPPAAAAGPTFTGVLETTEVLHGTGEGELEHLATRMNWNPTTLPEGRPALLVRAETIRVSVKDETKTTIVVGGKDYTHTDGDTVFVKEYRDATLHLNALTPASHVGLMCAETMWSHTTTSGTLAIEPPFPVADQTLDPKDARAKFHAWRPGDVQAIPGRGASTGTGDFSMLLENLTFTVAAGSEAQEFRASYDPGTLVNQPARHSNLRLYLVEVTGGTYDTTGVAGSTRIRSTQFDGILTGTLSVPSAQGTAVGASGSLRFDAETVDLSGTLDLDIRAGPDAAEDRLQIRFQQSPAAASKMDLPPKDGAAGVMVWALPLAVGGVLSMAGVAAATVAPLRTTLRNRRQTSGDAAPSPPVAPPGPTPLAAAELAYRADPGNIQRAMELALLYAGAQRYHDALPLLLMTVRQFPKSDVARYTTALALLHTGRTEDAVLHLEYAFRLNPLNVARFLKEGPAHVHGEKPEIERLIGRWARVYHETNARGYA